MLTNVAFFPKFLRHQKTLKTYERKVPDSKLRPKHQVEIYAEPLSECQTSGCVTLKDQRWFYDGVHRIPLLGRKMRHHCGVRVSKAVVSKLIGCHRNIRDGPQG